VSKSSIGVTIYGRPLRALCVWEHLSSWTFADVCFGLCMPTVCQRVQEHGCLFIYLGTAACVLRVLFMRVCVFGLCCFSFSWKNVRLRIRI